jgi:hypothetical protein
MVSTYTSKGDRRYRYYVCRAVHGEGKVACPAKSVAARLIEESVVAQVRAALTAEETREQLEISAPDWLAFDEGDPASLVRAIVQRVAYDGTSGAVSLELGR